MSATPGKVQVQAATEICGEEVFALRFLQARDEDWTRQLFFAEFDANATWLDQLKPAFGAKRFFYEEAREPGKGGGGRKPPNGTGLLVN